MSSLRRSTVLSVRTAQIGAALLVVVGLFCLYLAHASASLLPNRSVTLSDSVASATATYKLSFDIPAPETLGSIKLLFCANDPLFGDPCPAPAGFDISGATLSAQSGELGFSIDGAGTDANTLVLTRTAAPAAAGTVSYTVAGVTNPSGQGSFFGRLQTFASTDASGAENDHGGIAMNINNAISVTTTVPPYLLFCSGITIGGFDCGQASGNYINFGNLTGGVTASAQSQLLTATNAGSGYVMQVAGNTMTSGNNIISAMAVSDVSRPGLSQFGINLVANATPSVGANPVGPGTATAAPAYAQPNFFRFVSGDTIATATAVQDYRKFTVSYIINIPTGQAPGVYATTLTYVCLANF